MTFLDRLALSLYGHTKAEAHAEGRCLRCWSSVDNQQHMSREDCAEYRITALCPACSEEIAQESDE